MSRLVVKSIIIGALLISAGSLYGVVKANSQFKIATQFLQRAVFTLPGQQQHFKRIIYGNKEYGYFSTDQFQVKGDRVMVRFIPPGYRHALGFYGQSAHVDSQKPIFLGSKKFESPLPRKFASAAAQVTRGRFSSPFFLVSAAMLRGKFWRDDFRSQDVKVFHKSRYRFSFVTVLNRFGEVVWLHVPGDQGELFHTYVAAKQVGKGEYGLLFGKKAGMFQKVRFDGKVLADLRSRDERVPFTMHHDFIYDDGRLFTISSKPVAVADPRARRYGNSFLADQIIAVDLEHGRAKKMFSFLGTFRPAINTLYPGDDPKEERFTLWGHEKVDFDFLHLNAIEPTGDGYLVGVRNLNKVVMLSKDFRKLRWSLGWDKDDTFTIVDEKARFHHLHTPIQLRNGNIALLDNGYKHQRSRIVEYELDYQGNRAKKKWQFTPRPHLYSRNRGSLTQLENGDLLAYFVSPVIKGSGQGRYPPQDILIEIDKATSREKARMVRKFEVLSPGYRAIPLTSIGLESYIGSRF